MFSEVFGTSLVKDVKNGFDAGVSGGVDLGVVSRIGVG